mmetsp:Transcript_86625/g.240168  ORF Transcript_86625/g.240168 Transcript_86625/m.240168 type:complete len:340 (-) Transcript_86625:570-1589(-)
MWSEAVRDKRSQYCRVKSGRVARNAGNCTLAERRQRCIRFRCVKLPGRSPICNCPARWKKRLRVSSQTCDARYVSLTAPKSSSRKLGSTVRKRALKAARERAFAALWSPLTPPRTQSAQPPIPPPSCSLPRAPMTRARMGGVKEPGSLLNSVSKCASIASRYSCRPTFEVAIAVNASPIKPALPCQMRAATAAMTLCAAERRLAEVRLLAKSPSCLSAMRASTWALACVSNTTARSASSKRNSYEHASRLLPNLSMCADSFSLPCREGPCATCANSERRRAILGASSGMSVPSRFHRMLARQRALSGEAGATSAASWRFAPLGPAPSMGSLRTYIDSSS